ncbi:hypothetical protein [Pseudomonas sp. Xaverov 259]|uniref:hypothetical protein n=1 Tax=Pseudomonas sp. Xaverov 259 TaxID=2666086 RepID=UPI001C5B1153|nr:hypothetical protein [Pseudomonas sp. Xaverov 259]
MVITSDRVDALQDAQSKAIEQPLSVWMYSYKFQAASDKQKPISFYLALAACS